MYDEMGKRLRSLAGMIPQKHTLPSGADTVICSLEAFMQIKELAEEAANALEKLSKPRWIPVTERLPEDGKDVLCWISNKRRPGQGYGTVGCYNSIVTLWDLDADWASSLDITHWRTLPEPPKEG